MKKKDILIKIIFSLAFIFSWVAVWAVTPAEALQEAKKKLASTSSISADFSMKAGGKTIKGTLQSKGTKFVLTSNVSSNWYNGKDLYTYVPSQSETTVFTPTRSELAEVNPLLYINSSSEFKATGTKTKKPGVETVILIPSKSGTGVKSVTLELDSKTYLPKNIKLVPTSGGTIDVAISNIKLNFKPADSLFEYPASKYKNVKINDMR